MGGMELSQRDVGSFHELLREERLLQSFQRKPSPGDTLAQAQGDREFPLC